MAYLASQKAANSRSNRSMYSPNTPETALACSALLTNSTSAAPRCGLETGIFIEDSGARHDEGIGQSERIVLVLRPGTRPLGEYQYLCRGDSLECVALILACHRELPGLEHPLDFRLSRHLRH